VARPIRAGGGERDLNIRLGIAGVASIGTLVFDEPINFIDIVGLHYIISGVYFVNLSFDVSAH
jgi:small multidrug resistance pump